MPKVEAAEESQMWYGDAGCGDGKGGRSEGVDSFVWVDT